MVANVPEQSVFREVETIVEGNGQFDDAEVAGKVAAVTPHDIDDSSSKLFGKLRKLLSREFSKIDRRVNLLEKGH